MQFAGMRICLQGNIMGSVVLVHEDVWWRTTVEDAHCHLTAIKWQNF
jgi:hypothetical protein